MTFVSFSNDANKITKSIFVSFHISIVIITVRSLVPSNSQIIFPILVSIKKSISDLALSAAFTIESSVTYSSICTSSTHLFLDTVIALNI